MRIIRAESRGNVMGEDRYYDPHKSAHTVCEALHGQ